MKLEKCSTRSSTLGYCESVLNSPTTGVNAGFSSMAIQVGGSIETSVQFGRERSYEVTIDDGFTVSYSISTANTVGVEEKIITCDGVQNEKNNYT